MWSDISSQTSRKQLHNTGSYTNKDCSPVELSHQDKLLNISGTKRSSLLRSLQSLNREDADTVQASFKEFRNTLRSPTFGLSHCKQYTYVFDFNTSDIPGMVETFPTSDNGFHTSPRHLLFPLSCSLRAQEPFKFCLQTIIKPLHVSELAKTANASL